MSENAEIILASEQEITLNSERIKYGFFAKVLFISMDFIYGRKASLKKFKVLEVIARVPYIAWEQVSYIAITHKYSEPNFARKIHDEIQDQRMQQDNELYHLLIIEELLQEQQTKQGFIRFKAIPQIIAWGYYHISWLLFVIKPKYSYQLNAQFEDHAEHEYMEFVRDHPELETQQWESGFSQDYGQHDSVANLLRQIALDECHHKEESLERIKSARFS